MEEEQEELLLSNYVSIASSDDRMVMRKHRVNRATIVGWGLSIMLLSSQNKHS